MDADPEPVAPQQACERVWVQPAEPVVTIERGIKITRQALPEDPRFLRNDLRVKHRDELIPLIEAAVLLQPRQYWMEALERDQVPCGPVLTTGEILSQPRLRDRGAIVPSGEVEVLRSPMRFDGLEARVEPAPALGQHTQAVLEELR